MYIGSKLEEVLHMKRYTAPPVLAMEFCWDIKDVQEFRYQPGGQIDQYIL